MTTKPATATKMNLEIHRQQQADAEQEAERGFDDPALVVDASGHWPGRLAKRRIVRIERLLDLLELALLVLRKRHAPPMKLTRGDGSMTSIVTVLMLSPEYEREHVLGKSSESAKGG